VQLYNEQEGAITDRCWRIFIIKQCELELQYWWHKSLTVHKVQVGGQLGKRSFY